MALTDNGTESFTNDVVALEALTERRLEDVVVEETDIVSVDYGEIGGNFIELATHLEETSCNSIFSTEPKMGFEVI